MESNWRTSSKVILFSGIALLSAGVVVARPPASSDGTSTSANSRIGDPLRDLSASDLNSFNTGRQVFLRNEQPQTGLGPVFNGQACAQCHQAGAPGGAATNLGVAVVTRIGGTVNGVYSDLTQFGGPVIQARSLREFNPNYPVPREVVPQQAQFVSRRLTTPVFGDGLIEAIPDETILSRAGIPQADGVMGTANYSVDPATGQSRVGRFGWKCQHSTLLGFAGDAYLNEMGITNTLFPTENLPQGNPIPPGADQVPDPEDVRNDVQQLVNFMKLSAPPTRAAFSLKELVGENTFRSIQCTSCHVESMTTGPNAVAALSNVKVTLWSDLLLHHMGAGLNDGVQQNLAMGDMWRTAPLWGLSVRRLYLHDGRANSLDQAIRLHGGEATPAVNRYVGLSQTDRDNLLAFLNGL